jgi:hypothetical protein
MKIISRGEWGARYGDGFAPAPLPASEVWLHHSVTVAPDLVPPFDDEYVAMRTLERIGQERFGGGISYTWAAMPSGRIYQGHSVGRRGAHTRGRNSIARAVVLVGNYEDRVTTDAQREGVADLLRHAHEQGWIKQARLDGGHRDAPGAATACPGRHGMAAIADINRRAASEEDDMPSVDEIWGHKVRNLNGDDVRVDQVVVATEVRVAELQKEMDALKKLVDELRRTRPTADRRKRRSS